jgi:hypothetical protein
MARLIIARVETAHHETPILDGFIQALLNKIDDNDSPYSISGKIFKKDNCLYFQLSEAYQILSGYNNDKATINKELKLASYVSETAKAVKVNGGTIRAVIIDLKKFNR